jgi:hypothetical protein
MRGFVSSYNKKPQTLIVVLGLFFNKTWDFTIILIHVYSNIEKHQLLQ